jgi:hypothetical protein
VLFLSDAQTAGLGAVGFCDPETQTIGVVNSQANDALQDTFLHEVLHAICHVMGLRENREGRELRSTLGDRIVHGKEPQPCGV